MVFENVSFVVKSLRLNFCVLGFVFIVEKLSLHIMSKEMGEFIITYFLLHSINNWFSNFVNKVSFVKVKFKMPYVNMSGVQEKNVTMNIEFGALLRPPTTNFQQVLNSGLR